MITEDYVSYEVAKLLKEKGFNEYCLKNYWSSDKELHDWKWELSYNRNSDRNNNTKDCSAPTQAMAVAWLREVYGLYIWVDYSRLDCNEKQPYLWNIAETKINGDYWGGTYHKSSKEAVESALKYVLENLI